MSVKNTIRKVVCAKCGQVADTWYLRRKHGYHPDDCGGTFVAKDVTRTVLRGEFMFERSYGNRVYLKHVESGEVVNIFTVDLLKVLVGRPLGTLILTESRRGRESCWKAEEVSAQ